MSLLPLRSSLAAAPLLLAACLPPLDRPDGASETPLALADLGASGPPPWSEVTGEPDPPATSTTSGWTSATSAGATGASTGSSAGASDGTDDEPAALRDLRITEVLADPEGKDGGAGGPEIVEIVNRGPDPIPLGALVIQARSWPKLDARTLGLQDMSLGPGELLLLRRFASDDEADAPGVTRDGELVAVTFSASGGLRNADGAVMLRSAGGMILDALIYGGPAPAPYDDPEAWIGEPTAAAGSGVSLCRLAVQIDSDRADDWMPCAPSPGSVRGDARLPEDGATTGDAPGEAALVIVEVLSNAPGPGVGEKHLEYVELLNLGPGDVDLADFTIADDVDPGAPGRDPLLYRGGDGGCAPATCLGAGRRALIVGNLYEGPTGEALVLETDDSTIADGGLSAAEAVILRDGDDLVVSTYRAWDDPLSEPYPVAVESPLHRFAAKAADEPASWAYGEPSPGLP